MPPNEQQIILDLLSEVHRDSRATQREIATNMGIALGLANGYLKRCVKKGLIKVSQAPPNRYLYYLTPAGFSEKARLTGDYLAQSFDFFRNARSQCRDVLDDVAARGWRRVALVGASELAEIMALCATGTAIELVGVIDPAAEGNSVLAGLPVLPSLVAANRVDGIVITALQGAQAVYDSYAAELGHQRLMAPALLGLSIPESGGL
ncbi:MAG: winged helix-turn-helix transcriptional regulator [Magnetospirillum sp.]|nr:winged helix-turn-helix transcriptional regulator [Magnetospirillum sp.]